MTSGVYERTPEMNAANSKRHTGVPLSPEHSNAIARSRTPEFNSAMSDALKNSEAAKAESERQRGGEDICDHHYIYDHSDLSKYTMKMTRSRHQRLHWLLRKSGNIVSHINMKEK